MDRSHQLLCGRALEHVSGSAGAQRLTQIFLALMHRQDHDRGIGTTFADLARRFQAVELGHRHVEHRDVGPQLARHGDGCTAVIGASDDLEIAVRFEHHAHAVTQHRVIVGQEYACII